MPVLIGLDNINSKAQTGYVSIKRVSTSAFNGVNTLAHAPRLKIPTNISFERKDISELEDNFIYAELGEKRELDRLRQMMFARSAVYTVTKPSPTKFKSVVNISLTNNIESDEEEEEEEGEPDSEFAKRTNKLLPMEVILGLDTTLPVTKMEEFHQEITEGDVEDPDVLKSVLVKMLEKYQSLTRKVLLMSIDQAIWVKWQEYRGRAEWVELDQCIRMIQEMWHGGLCLHHGIISAYEKLLRSILTVAGLVTQSQWKSFASCARLRKTHPVLGAVFVAVQSECIAEMLSREGETQSPSAYAANILLGATTLADSRGDQHSQAASAYSHFKVWLGEESVNNPYLKMWAQYMQAFEGLEGVWVSQRIGSYDLYNGAISADGSLFTCPVWNRNRYTYAFIEQLRDERLSSEYEKYVTQNKGLYIRVREQSNVLRCHGDVQEFSVHLAKKITKRMDVEGNSFANSIWKLAPVEKIRRNLEELSKTPNRYRHYFQGIDLDMVNNIRAIFKKGNLLGFQQKESQQVDIVAEEPVSPLSFVYSPDVEEMLIESPSSIGQSEDEPNSEQEQGMLIQTISTLRMGNLGTPPSDMYWESFDTSYRLKVELNS